MVLACALLVSGVHGVESMGSNNTEANVEVPEAWKSRLLEIETQNVNELSDLERYQMWQMAEAGDGELIYIAEQCKNGKKLTYILYYLIDGMVGKKPLIPYIKAVEQAITRNKPFMDNYKENVEQGCQGFSPEAHENFRLLGCDAIAEKEIKLRPHKLRPYKLHIEDDLMVILQHLNWFREDPDVLGKNFFSNRFRRILSLANMTLLDSLWVMKQFQDAISNINEAQEGQENCLRARAQLRECFTQWVEAMPMTEPILKQIVEELRGLTQDDWATSRIMNAILGKGEAEQRALLPCILDEWMARKVNLHPTYLKMIVPNPNGPDFTTPVKVGEYYGYTFKSKISQTGKFLKTDRQKLLLPISSFQEMDKCLSPEGRAKIEAEMRPMRIMDTNYLDNVRRQRLINILYPQGQLQE